MAIRPLLSCADSLLCLIVEEKRGLLNKDFHYNHQIILEKFFVLQNKSQTRKKNSLDKLIWAQKLENSASLFMRKKKREFRMLFITKKKTKQKNPYLERALLIGMMLQIAAGIHTPISSDIFFFKFWINVSKKNNPFLWFTPGKRAILLKTDISNETIKLSLKVSKAFLMLRRRNENELPFWSTKGRLRPH